MPQNTHRRMVCTLFFLLLIASTLTGWLRLQSSLLQGSSVRIGVNVVQPIAQILDVTSPNQNGTYVAGQTLQVNVQFDQVVYVNTISGTPTITFNSGGTGAYSSGSGSDTLVFTYAIAIGDITSDLDESSTVAIALNGATIHNSDNVNATVTLPSPGASGSLGANKNIIIAEASTTTNNSESTVVAGGSTGGGGRRTIPTVASRQHPAAPMIAQNSPAVCATTIAQDIYRDVPQSAWFAYGVRTFLCKGYLDTSLDLFRSGSGSTRAEVAKLVTMVHTLTGSLMAPSSFDDVDNEEWYAAFAEQAAKYRIMLGTDNCFGSRPCLFRPAAPITRAEFAATLVRSFGISSKGTVQAFSDVSADAWYYETITTAAEHCILQGDPVTGAMRPDDQVNRAEMIVMLDRIQQGSLHCPRNPPQPFEKSIVKKEAEPKTDISEFLPTPSTPDSSLPLINDAPAQYLLVTSSTPQLLLCGECRRCGEGWTNLCDAEECSMLGSCTFTRTQLQTTCAPDPSNCSPE